MRTPTHASFATLVAAAVLAGCASGVKLDETPVETRTATPVGSAAGSVSTTPGATSGAAGQSRVTTVDLTKPVSGASSSNLARVVYFDFDSFVIKDEYKPLIEGHAKLMSSAKTRRLVVEGHADERGSREYNLALGQKRAEAVRRALTLVGATDAQIEAVSFGEESPAVAGSSEDAYARNRRVELRYR